MTIEEIWEPIPSFPDYAVSNLGHVKRVVPGKRNHACHTIKPWLGNHGYETVGLTKDGAIHRRLIHRLVCEAFHGPAPDESFHVAHADGTRRNNRADNLRWATRSENMEDSRAHGTMALGARHGRTVSPERNPRGEAHGHAKLTESDVLAIRAENNMSGRAVAGQYGVSPATICLIRSRKIWSHI